MIGRRRDAARCRAQRVFKTPIITFLPFTVSRPYSGREGPVDGNVTRRSKKVLLTPRLGQPDQRGVGVAGPRLSVQERSKSESRERTVTPCVGPVAAMIASRAPDPASPTSGARRGGAT